jgi:hypothetical protein
MSMPRPLPRRRFVAALVAGATVALVGATPRATFADAKPRVEIVLIAAKSDPKGPKMDAALQKYAAQLTQPPISAYNSFKFVDQKTLPLDKDKPADPWKGKPAATYALVNGKTLDVALLDTLDGGKRFQMGAAISGTSAGNSPDLIKYSAPPNEPVFIAGQSYDGGVLVVGITLRP